MVTLSTRGGRLLALGAFCGAAYACVISFDQPLAPPLEVAGVQGTLATDAIWGVADLHAHPAAHLAFGGLDGASGLIWGDPGLDGGLSALEGGNLGDIPACDPETHSANVTDEVSRATRAMVFGLLTDTTNFPHVAHGGPAADGDPAYESWPNGRDILHETMNIQSIRRAYDGGLRLMFAATVDSQPIGLAMRTTIFPPDFVPSRAAELASAEAQILFIRAAVSANASWMEIATTPEQAEDAIRSNRLAIVLALENDGLLLDDVRYLVDTYGVAAIVPIHLIDNDVGGSAAYNNVFNAGTQLMGSMFGYPNRYISVDANPLFGFHLGWPLQLAISGPSFMVQSVSYAANAALGYQQYPLCDPPGQGIPDEIGSSNSVGLRSPETIRALMGMGLMIDVAHMGFRSTAETIDLARSNCQYPLVDTHTSFHFVDGGNGGDERALYGTHANYIADVSGVIGQGSTGRVTRDMCGDRASGSETIASARGGPLASFDGAQTKVVVRLSPNGRGCVDPFALPGDGGAALTMTTLGLRVVSAQSVPDGHEAYAKVRFDDGHSQWVPIGLNSVTSITLDGGRAFGSVAAIDVGILMPSACGYTNAATVDVDVVEIRSPDGSLVVGIGQNELGVASNASHSALATLGPKRSSFTPYERCPAKIDALTPCDPAEAYLQAPNEPTEHLRVRVRSGTLGLKSSSGLTIGTRVAGSLCATPDCSEIGDVNDPCVNPMFTMTPAGGWPAGLEVDQYIGFPRPAPRAFQAVTLCVMEENLATEPWEIDELDVDVVVDPIRMWSGDYQYNSSQVFGSREGQMALGTDSNGLSPQFAFSDYAPAYAEDAEGCGVTAGDVDGGAAQYGDPSSGGRFTLRRPQHIGRTPLCLPERGLASYGMFPELFATIYHYNPNAYRSLFQSARATIEAWRATRNASATYATNPVNCVVADSGADANAETDAAESTGSASDAGAK